MQKKGGTRAVTKTLLKRDKARYLAALKAQGLHEF